MGGRLVSAFLRNLLNGHLCIGQELHSQTDPLGGEIIPWSEAGLFLELSGEIIFAESTVFSNRIQGNLLFEVLFYVILGFCDRVSCMHLLLIQKYAAQNIMKQERNIMIVDHIL